MKSIQQRLALLEKRVGVRESKVSVSDAIEKSFYDQNQFKKVLAKISENCKEQFKQNPQSSVIIDLYKNKPAILVKGTQYPESFQDGIEKALEDFGLFVLESKTISGGYVITLSGY